MGLWIFEGSESNHHGECLGGVYSHSKDLFRFLERSSRRMLRRGVQPYREGHLSNAIEEHDQEGEEEEALNECAILQGVIVDVRPQVQGGCYDGHNASLQFTEGHQPFPEQAGKLR